MKEKKSLKMAKEIKTIGKCKLLNVFLIHIWQNPPMANIENSINHFKYKPICQVPWSAYQRKRENKTIN